jgi:hypothetical protein
LALIFKNLKVMIKMKTKNIAGTILVSVAILAGCSDDFLSRPPQDSVVDANYYQTDDQLLAGTAALYSAAWKDFCDQANWKIGDVRAGLVYSPWATSVDVRDFTTFNVTGLSAGNVNAYKAFYQVIGQANTVIHNINLYAATTVTPAVKNYAIAEARFIRATAYSYLVMNYGAVPVIEDNIKYLSNPVLKRNTIESVWEFVKREYQFAARNLVAQAPQAGRLTQWSAEGMLARTYLTMAGITGTLNQSYLDSAKYFANHVITSSGKQLLPNYATLFRYPDSENTNESLFELQWVYSSNADYSYKYSNTMVSQITPDNSIAANSDGWGGGVSATIWGLNLYDGLLVNYSNGKSGAPGFTPDKRFKETFMLPGFSYPELAVKGGTFMSPDKVVQYNPTQVTETNPTDGQGYSFANIKKYVIGPIPGQTGKQDYPNNTYMLRLAELYLIYAEASVLSSGGSTMDGQAMAAFNAVHTRAGLPPFTDPLTWDVIFKERAKEFAMEGMVWYDLVRLHYYNAQHAYEILNSQDRGMYLVIPKPWPNPTGWSFYKTTWFSTSDVVQASDANFMLPIPQVELSQAPSLSEDPVPYQFSH